MIASQCWHRYIRSFPLSEGQQQLGQDLVGNVLDVAPLQGLGDPRGQLVLALHGTPGVIISQV